MKNKLLKIALAIVVGALFFSCKQKERKYSIIQKHYDGELHTKVDDNYSTFYIYRSVIKVDSSTDVKKERLKAEKAIEQFKKIDNELKNINNK